MNKLFIFLVMFCMMFVSVSALVQYTGNPDFPYIIYGHVNWNSQLLSGARLQITNQNTGNVAFITTNENGYYQEEAGNWLTNDKDRSPIIFGDIIKVKVTDGCGTGDICEKTFIAKSGDYKISALIDFSITGTLTCPSSSCPSCGSCSGGGSCNCGGSGSSVVYKATQEICNTDFPCTVTTCPAEKICPAEKVCPEEKVCETYQTCEVCKEPVCPEQDINLSNVIIAIITFIIGGGAVYITLGTANKVKVVKKNGIDIVMHQHPTVSGYHSPDTIHRSESHKKGELVPKYEKDSSGAWRYKA